MYRKKISHILIFLLTLLVMHTSSALALSSPPADLHIPFSENKSEWRDMVCQPMTADGCAYFTANESDFAWQTLKEINAAGMDVHFKHKVTGFGESIELWQIELNVFTSSGEHEMHEVYATVSTKSGQPLIDRIITFDQILIVSGIPQE